jgi:inhibitor of the pro-sigma K processing machinery
VKLGLRYGKYLVVNSILGIIVLALADFIGIAVPINLFTILVCALAGIPGALLVIILFLLGIIA